MYIHTYHSRFILEAEASQIFLQDAHVLPKLASNEEYCRRDRWQPYRRLIAVFSGVSAVNPLVAFYEHPWKKERGAILLLFL
jgi:hypothetical protein